MKRKFFLFLVFFIYLDLYPQEKKDVDNLLKSKYLKAKEYIKVKKYEEAKIELITAIDIDPKFYEAYSLLGDLFVQLDEYQKAKETYKKAIKLNPNYSYTNYYNLGIIQFNLQEYDDAKMSFSNMLKFNEIPESVKKKGIYYLQCSEFASEGLKKPVPFNPINMGDSINSEYDEYLPTITADEEIFIITRRMPINYDFSKLQEDFFISYKKDGKWTKAINMGKPINTPKNEGAQTISPDGRFFIFTSCNKEDGYGSCDLYISYRNGDNWTKPINLGNIVNSEEWDSQPSFSSDGKTLYFASSRPGGIGGIDIWKTTLIDSGKWSKPVNLGAPINTPNNELSPFIHPDNNTLYFSSNGHIGFGGYDFYLSRKQSNEKWSTPVNLGYPINTPNDEVSLIISASGDKAYFASDRLKDSKKMDLYEFELYSEIKPNPVSYLKGKIFDKNTKKPLKADFELIDLETGNTIVKSFSDKINGEFIVCIPNGKNYALNASLDGYLFFSENISTINNKYTSLWKEIPLIPIEKNEKIILRNIFFDSDKYTLKKESYPELEKLLLLLKSNKTLVIEISGHTDNTNTDSYNLSLSQKRANAVKDYLVSKGIEENRILAIGYGEKFPIADNTTPEGRALNRRTEIKIISK